jgi:hypothetical protein
METQNQYIPGVCNIGNEEVKMRKRTGQIGLVVTIALWASFIWFNVPQIWRLTLFISAMMSATGFLQAYTHFCAYFGFASLFNFGDVGKTDSVQQAEFRAKDKKKAWQIVVYSVLIGLTVALLAYNLS